MITIRSQRSETSFIAWLEKSTAEPRSRNSRIISRIRRVLITSSPFVGSSSSTFCGRWTSARASSTRDRSPWEYPFARRSTNSSMPSRRMNSAVRVSVSAAETPRRRAK